MPRWNLVGDLSRLHPSPDLSVFGRSIARTGHRAFPFPLTRSDFRCFSFSPAGETDDKDLHAATRQIDQSINRSNQWITTASSASHERLGAVSRRVFPGRRDGKDTWISPTIDPIDRSRARSTRRSTRSFSRWAPRSDRGHRTSATAAEISNLFAASKRGSECPRESAQRVQAWLNAPYRHARIKCVCVSQMCARVSDGGEYFTSLWVVNQIRRIFLPAGLADSWIQTNHLPRFDQRYLIIFDILYFNVVI